METYFHRCDQANLLEQNRSGYDVTLDPRSLSETDPEPDMEPKAEFQAEPLPEMGTGANIEKEQVVGLDPDVGADQDIEVELDSRTAVSSPVEPRSEGAPPSTSENGGSHSIRLFLPSIDPKLVYGLAGSLSLVLICLVLFFEPVGDLFFRYFSGPVIADAREEQVDGTTKGYNIYNTLAYGGLFLAGGLAIHLLLIRLKVNIDEKLILASLPLIVLGGLARTLEDTRLFGEPTAYLFIAPVIYVTLALGAVGVLVWGALLREFYHRVRPAFAGGLAAYGCVLFLLTYFLLWHFGTDQLEHLVPPVQVLALMVLLMGMAYAIMGLKPLCDPVILLGLAGIFAVGLTLLWIAAFMNEPWREGIETQPDIAWEVALVWGSAMVVTIGGMIALKRLAPTIKEHLTPYLAPLSIALFAAHFLDGAATYLGIELYGYSEKHVLPDFLIGLFGTAAVMLPLKAGVVFLVVYMLDVIYKDELHENRSLLMLVKLLILTLGLAPGTRDVARIFLGV